MRVVSVVREERVERVERKWKELCSICWQFGRREEDGQDELWLRLKVGRETATVN